MKKIKYDVKEVIKKLGNDFPLNELDINIQTKEYFKINKINYAKLNKGTFCNVKIHFDNEIFEYNLDVNFDKIHLLDECIN